MFRLLAVLLGLTVLVSALDAHATDYNCHLGGNLSDARCLTLTNQNGTVVITNRRGDPIKFSLHEWHSHCGWPGGRVFAITQTIGPNATLEFPMIPNTEDPYQCREDFVFDCSMFGTGLSCFSTLDVFVRIP